MTLATFHFRFAKDLGLSTLLTFCCGLLCHCLRGRIFYGLLGRFSHSNWEGFLPLERLCVSMKYSNDSYNHCQFYWSKSWWSRSNDSGKLFYLKRESTLHQRTMESWLSEDWDGYANALWSIYHFSWWFLRILGPNSEAHFMLPAAPIEYLHLIPKASCSLESWIQ